LYPKLKTLYTSRDLLPLAIMSATVAQSDDLPTLDRLGARSVDLSAVDAAGVAHAWCSKFSDLVTAGNSQGISELFIPDGHWRDILALTWDFRTFTGRDRIRTFLSDRLTESKLTNITLDLNVAPELSRPFSDVAWIHAFFVFETPIGRGSGVFRLVPDATGAWNTFTVGRLVIVTLSMTHRICRFSHCWKNSKATRKRLASLACVVYFSS
jgi:hypothetical protein